ncbi:MAG: helix-turn-helix domain-containing protein [Dongiaceae bacterium]
MSSPILTQSLMPEMSLSQSVELHLRRFFQSNPASLSGGQLYDLIVQEVERPLITLTLEATRGNQLKAAKLLGINRNTLHKKMRILGLKT